MNNLNRLKDLLKVGLEAQILKNDFINLNEPQAIRKIVKVVDGGVYWNEEKFNCFLRFPDKSYKISFDDEKSTFTISKRGKDLTYRYYKNRKDSE